MHTIGSGRMFKVPEKRNGKWDSWDVEEWGRALQKAEAIKDKKFDDFRKQVMVYLKKEQETAKMAISSIDDIKKIYKEKSEKDMED